MSLTLRYVSRQLSSLGKDGMKCETIYTQTIGLKIPAKKSFGNMCAIGRESDQPHNFTTQTYGIWMFIAMILIPVLAFS